MQVRAVIFITTVIAALVTIGISTTMLATQECIHGRLTQTMELIQLHSIFQQQRWFLLVFNLLNVDAILILVHHI